MRVLCLIPSMGAGGAERVMALLVGHLSLIHDVALATWEEPGTPSFYPLPATLEVLQLDRLGGHGLRWLRTVSARPGTLRRLIRRISPDVVVSFMDMMSVAALVGGAGLGTPLVVAIRNDATRGGDPLRRFLRDRAFAFADRIVVQTDRIARQLPAKLAAVTSTIANPVPAASDLANPYGPGLDGRYRIISVGRLVAQKDHARLITAFARLADTWPDWDLTIVGDGPERAALQAMIESHGLEFRIQLPGITREVGGELSRAHVMAFPSRYEGFPNALAEAMVAGLPAIGNVGVSGVEDLIVNEVTGLLVDPAGGPGELAVALAKLMGDASLRQRMGDAGRRHAAQWTPESVFHLWDDLLDRVVAARQQGRTEPWAAGSS